MKYVEKKCRKGKTNGRSDVTEMKANRDNREYVLKAVQNKGKLLEFAIPEFQDDEEL